MKIDIEKRDGKIYVDVHLKVYDGNNRESCNQLKIRRMLNEKGYTINECISGGSLDNRHGPREGKFCFTLSEYNQKSPAKKKKTSKTIKKDLDITIEDTVE